MATNRVLWCGLIAGLALGASIIMTHRGPSLDDVMAALPGASWQRGSAVYDERCTGCHHERGWIGPDLSRSLEGMMITEGRDATQRYVIMSILDPAAENRTGGRAMPALTLTASRIADVVVYVMHMLE